MTKNKRNRINGKRFWASRPRTLTAEKDLDSILGSVTRLPLRYWRPRMFFFGARDKTLFSLSRGGFPKKPVSGKTHPVFSLRPLPHGTGYRVCPCSSKKPFTGKFRYIKKGCRLMHTGYQMDRNAYLVEGIRFNMPVSEAMALRFRGEVPDECMAMRPKRSTVFPGRPGIS